MKTSYQQIKRIHYNLPQLRSALIGAPEETLIAGRGTGKTEGVLAYKSAVYYLGTMPRSTGVIVGASYNQILTRTLPGLVAGWEKLGYMRDVHFVIGKRPSQKWIDKWKWKGPWRPPLSYKYIICWWNGAVAYLVSQDIKGSSNGLTIDWIIGDEAKLLDHKKLTSELMPANRGIREEYDGNPFHHGVTFTTDMPTGSGGRWLLEREAKSDNATANEILKLQYCIQLLKQKKPETQKQKRLIAQQIDIIKEEINELRKDLFYYHTASSIDNIHALGMKYIKQQLRETTEFQFNTQILNLKSNLVEHGFYPDFDETVHGYFASNNKLLQQLNFDFDKIESLNCLRDSDVDTNKPLHIAIDYNRRIHPLVVAQYTNKQIKIVKGMHVLAPLKLKDVVAEFIQYYKPHKKKIVYYWYDQTATSDMHETRQCDDVVRALRKAGWAVIEMYTAAVPFHEDKYNMYGHLLTNDGHYQETFSINRENCSNLITSINLSPAEIRKKGFGKDKRTEDDENFPAQDSTHYSDAMDMIVTGILLSGLNFNKS